MDTTQVIGGFLNSLFHDQHDTQDRPFRQSSNHLSHDGLEYSTTSSSYLSPHLCFGIMTGEVHNSPGSFVKQSQGSSLFSVPLGLFSHTYGLVDDLAASQHIEAPRFPIGNSEDQPQSTSKIWNNLQRRVRVQQSHQFRSDKSRKGYRAAESAARLNSHSRRAEDLSSNTAHMPQHYYQERWIFRSNRPSRHRSPAPELPFGDLNELFDDRGKTSLQEELARGQRKATQRLDLLRGERRIEEQNIATARGKVRSYKDDLNYAYSRRVPYQEVVRLTAKVHKYETIMEEARERLSDIEAEISDLKFSIEINNAKQSTRKAEKPNAGPSRRRRESFPFPSFTSAHEEMRGLFPDLKADFDGLHNLFGGRFNLSPEIPRPKFSEQYSGKGKARQKEDSRFVPRDEYHERLQREYTRQARRRNPPEQHLDVAEARDLFEEYNNKWPSDPKDPDIPWPARKFRPDALKDIQSLWAPNTRKDVPSWSEEEVMKANAQAVFLGAVGLAPTYHEDKKGKLQLGFDIDNATAEQKKKLTGILKKEWTRWHYDRLCNRNAGLNDGEMNEALGNDERGRAIFHVVTDLINLLKL